MAAIEAQRLNVAYVAIAKSLGLPTQAYMALSDGKQYLIEKYATAVTPGVTMTDPKPLNRENINILSLGGTKPL